MSTVTFADAPVATDIIDPAGLLSGLVAGFGLNFTKSGRLHFSIDVDYLISNNYDMLSGTGRISWIF